MSQYRVFCPDIDGAPTNDNQALVELALTLPASWCHQADAPLFAQSLAQVQPWEQAGGPQRGTLWTPC